MRSWDRVAGWASWAVAAATLLTLACGGSDEGGVQLNGVAFGNGIFITVGETNTAFVNAGPGWVPFVTGVGSLNEVAFAPVQNLFVAVGDGGAIVTSVDGTGWTQQVAPTGFNLHDVTAGAGSIVAVGDGGTVLSSTDGVTWTQRNSGTEAALFGVGFGQDVFLAVGAGGTVVDSTDNGTTWTAGSTGIANDLFAAARGPLGWVAVGAGGAIEFSPALGAWQVVGLGTLPNLNDVVFTQSIFVVVGDEGNILTSPEGANYTFAVSDTGQFINGVAFGNGNFVAVSTGGRVLTSIDAVVWQNGKI